MSCDKGQASLSRTDFFPLAGIVSFVNAAKRTDHPIQAIAFDMDGLLFNTEQLYPRVLDEVLRRRGKRYTADLVSQMMGRPGPIALQIMIDYHDLKDSIEGLADECEVIFLKILEVDAAMMPGALELLGRVEAAGIPKAIATSSGRKYVDWLLSRFDLTHRFDFFLTAESVKQGKPHPEIYLTAAGQHGVRPDQMVVLEDSQNGLRAAVAAGTKAIAVPGDHSHHHDFTGAQFVANTLRDERIAQLLGLGEA